jgi:integrase/recombinase XerD
MTPLAQALTDYLTIRRSLGYKLERAGKLLGRFVAYLNDVGAHTVTTEQALAWATMPSGADPNWLAHRLLVVRGFASYLHTIDPAAEVPPADLLPARPCRATPYLYSDGDIAALIAAAGTLRSPLRAMTYKTLIGLLAVTGLRIGEAIRLDRDDIDWDHALLIVRDSKFGKSREIPLHETTVRALRDYSRERNQLYCGRPSVPAVFISTAGSRLLYCNVNWTFLRLVRRAGLKPRSGSCRPRLHDIRHSFAVRSLLEAYQTGSDVKVRLSLLSTYLGHVDPGATYWYLSAAPELLALAGQRLDDHLGGGS